MLGTEVIVPLWALIVLIGLASWAAYDRIFVPSVRWYIRRKVNRAIADVNSRLRTTLRPFHLTKRQVLVDRLVYDAEVIQAMQKYADEKNMPREVAQSRVTLYAKEIVPAFNAYVYFRFGYWFSKVLSRLLYRVRVGAFDEHLLEGVDPEATVVFVMNHRSNMDYILVSHLVAEESTLSYAVGEWARVWPLSALIKAMGAFFVRRGSGDPLYRKILQRYVHMATQEGVCQAVFLEGNLSHDGKMREPKMGFLNYMLRQYNPESDRVIVFVPIAINYDRIIEDRNLIRRRDPEAEAPSKWRMFKATLRFYFEHMAVSTHNRHKRWGYAVVNFGRPLSIHDFCEQENLRLQDVDEDARREVTERLAKRLMREIAFVMPILPLPLLATVFGRANGSALTAFELKNRVMDLVEELQNKGAPIRDSEKPKEGTIMRALGIMQHRGMIVEENGHYRSNTAEADLLAFYRASLEHWETEAFRL